MRRRSQASIVANPVLVGAVTTLVVVVAVFLAYNANNGLPFVPTRELKVQIANGANLVKGNEVRSGGYRVGVVEDMAPSRLPNGTVGALLTLKLDQKVGEVPVDSTVVIRPRSALGLKYVELTTGRSDRMLEDGATLPVEQAKVPVELDEFYNIFDEPTRRASQENLLNGGTVLSGRGYDINETIRVAPTLFAGLARVMRNLRSPETKLDQFFKELGDAARVVAPVSQTNAAVFTAMADTFEAFSRDEQALKDTIAKTPDNLRVGTESLRVQRPFLEDTALLSEDLRAATVDLKGTLAPLNRALAVAAPVQRRSVALQQDLQSALASLRDLSTAPTTLGALRGLTATVATLQPTLRYVGPYITVCNTWNFFWTLTAEHFTAPAVGGTSERVLLNSGDQQAPDSISAQAANEFAHGEKSPNPEPTGDPMYLHGNVHGNEAVAPDGQANCQPGQAGYLNAGNPYRDKSIPGDPYRNAVVDSPTRAQYPGVPNQGPLFKRLNRAGKQEEGSGLQRDRVPAGETFTNDPGGKGINP